MLTEKEKEEIWNAVSKEFSSDVMLRDLHFIRGLITALKKKMGTPKTGREISLIAREEFIEWLKLHPQYEEER